MKKNIKGVLWSFALELLVYAALVTGYFFLVLHFLGNWLNWLFHNERKTYAALALILIIGQGILLEICTRLLLGSIRRGKED